MPRTAVVALAESVCCVCRDKHHHKKGKHQKPTEATNYNGEKSVCVTAEASEGGMRALKLLLSRRDKCLTIACTRSAHDFRMFCQMKHSLRRHLSDGVLFEDAARRPSASAGAHTCDPHVPPADVCSRRGRTNHHLTGCEPGHRRAGQR